MRTLGWLAASPLNGPVGELLFAAGSAVTAVVVVATGLIVRTRTTARAARWYARILIVAGALAGGLALWFVGHALA